MIIVIVHSNQTYAVWIIYGSWMQHERFIETDIWLHLTSWVLIYFYHDLFIVLCFQFKLYHCIKDCFQQFIMSTQHGKLTSLVL